MVEVIASEVEAELVGTQNPNTASVEVRHRATSDLMCQVDANLQDPTHDWEF